MKVIVQSVCKLDFKEAAIFNEENDEMSLLSSRGLLSPNPR
jgi:hypothetical protein